MQGKQKEPISGKGVPKRLLSMMLAVLLAIALVPAVAMSAFAAPAPAPVQTLSLKAGDRVTVTASYTGGSGMFDILFEWDGNVTGGYPLVRYSDDVLVVVDHGFLGNTALIVEAGTAAGESWSRYSEQHPNANSIDYGTPPNAGYAELALGEGEYYGYGEPTGDLGYITFEATSDIELGVYQGGYNIYSQIAYPNGEVKGKTNPPLAPMIFFSDASAEDYGEPSVTGDMTHSVSVTTGGGSGYDATMSLGNVTGEPGETITVPVTVTSTVPFIGGNVRFTYDSTKLTVNPANSEDFGYIGYYGGIAPPAVHPLLGVGNMFVEFYGNARGDIVKEPGIYTLYLSITITDSAEGSYPLTLVPDTFKLGTYSTLYDEDWDDIDVGFTSGSITVGGTTQPVTYDVTVPAFANGTITASPTSAQAGETVTLTISPDSGYGLKVGSLKVNDGAVSVSGSENTYTFTMPAEAVGVTASFEGISTHYYTIDTPEDLVWFAEYVNADHLDANARLTDDIDMTGVYFPEIGYDLWHRYAGIFDGNGYSITLYMIGEPSRGGLFNITTPDAVVRNLTVKGTISGSGSYSGFVRDNYGAQFIDCVNEADITGAGAVGIGGGSGSYTRCINRGDLVGIGNPNGGSAVGIGGGSSASFLDCENYGSITGIGNTASATGIGSANNATRAGIVRNCANYGAVSGGSQAAGILGSYTGATESAIENCVNEGDVRSHSGAGMAAGIVADVSNATITGCVNFGSVTLAAADQDRMGMVGGIFARSQSIVTVTSCYNGGDIVSNRSVIWQETNGQGGLIGLLAEGGKNDGPILDSQIHDNYSTGSVVYLPGGLSAEPLYPVINPIIGNIASTKPATGQNGIVRNYYVAQGISTSYPANLGEPIDPSNAAAAETLLKGILAGVGIPDAVKYNIGGYPVPERLWDGEGEGGGGGEQDDITITFNVDPATATVVLSDADGDPVEPLTPGSKSYSVAPGRYSWTVEAEGYTSQTSDGTLAVDRLVTVSLRRSDPGQYTPGWGKWRPSFGIFILNPDGVTGTRIGNWDYDEALGTYVDTVTGEEAPFVVDYSDNPLVYTGVDRFSAARLGVVKKAIPVSGVIDYYNSYVEAHPELGLTPLDASTVDDFNMLCATNSAASEDPYASNSPLNPGRWAWNGWNDAFTGTSRYYYPDFAIGANNWGGGSGSTEYRDKPLGEGVERESVLAITSFNERIMRLPQDGSIPGLQDGVIDNAVELEAAVDYLASVADNERALRNFTGMLPDNSKLPLGADDSYFVGSVWITAPAPVPVDPGEKVGLPGSGDFDGDGNTTIDEALLLVQLINNDALDTLSPAQFAALDINADGELTMADALLIVQIILRAA